jgi:hypothetical protein
MKKSALVLFCFSSVLAAVIWSGCQSSQNKTGISTGIVNIPASGEGVSNGKLPVMVFADTSHQFGDMKQGEKVSWTYSFKNTGNADLVIASAVGSCGCTVPHFPKGTVHPGDTGTIDVTFDSEGKQGKVFKSVTVVTNCQPSTKILTFTANIQTPKYQ